MECAVPESDVPASTFLHLPPFCLPFLSQSMPAVLLAQPSSCVGDHTLQAAVLSNLGGDFAVSCPGEDTFGIW